MEMTVRPMTEQEQMYCYTQSPQIQAQTGSIGYLRADMDTNGEGFFSTWNGFRDDLKTQFFKEEFDELINSLRFGEKDDAFLKNRSTLTSYCFSHREAQMKDPHSFGFRVDTAVHTYMMRLNPNKGEYNLYCYCYKRKLLDRHLQEAEKGIRFIDSRYNDLFRIPDGGKIRISYPDGDHREEICRYIDPYHVEIGYGSLSLFHICEFAEKMERAGARVEPLEHLPVKQKNKGGNER